MEETKNTNVAYMEGTNETVNVEVVHDPGAEDLITNENIDDFKLLNMASQLNDFKHLADDIRAKKNVIGSEDDYLDKALENVTLEEVQKMDYAEIIKLCTPPEGVEDVFGTGFDTKIEEGKFKKDYMIFRKQSNDALKGIDEEIAKFTEEIAEYEEDMDRLMKEYSNLSGYVKKTLNDRLESAETEEQRAHIANIIHMMDIALTLDNLIEYYSNDYRARTAIPNVIGPKGKDIIKRYQKVLASINCRTDFRQFADKRYYKSIEQDILPDEYKTTHENAFIYAVVNYIASLYKNEDNKMNGVFLAQFSVNLKNFIYDKFESAEEKEIFTKAVCKVVDLVK